MNLNRILVILFGVLMFTSYETDSSLLFTILMKLLMIKGALFMSMPLSIGAFVMGQGMGFFAGNMMGGYMMLRAANRYHHKEKGKWVTHSGWHGPPFHTTTYEKGYSKGKAIIDSINAGQAKLKAIGSIFKAFIPSTTAKYGPPKYKPPPPVKYGPPTKYGPPKYGGNHPSHGYYNDFSYGSYSNPVPTTEPAPAYGAPYSTPANDLYIPPGEGTPGIPLSYEDYYPNGNRKNGFSSVLSSMANGEKEDVNIRRSHKDVPVSPSGFYTSAYGTPGQEFTGILTNEPTKQGDKYLRGDSDLADSPTKQMVSSVTQAPNEILESYIEQRLKAEAAKAETQKDMERKEEAQQLVQMLRKAYLKQLVDSLKEEELGQKQKTSRHLATSAFASLSSSIESLFGSRESRSMEHNKDGNEVDVNSARQTSKNLIRDLLVNEVFTSSAEGSSKDSQDNIDTGEVESITERIMSLTSTERDELVKGLDELGQEQEEAVLTKPVVNSNENEQTTSSSSSPENSADTDANGLPKLIPGAEWIPVDDEEVSNIAPFSIRMKRQAGNEKEALPTQSPSVAPAGNSQEQQQIQGFVEDIRKFFTLLSALDQDQCLQKLVCDVHTNEKDLTSLTQYEQNILTTFKLMKALMPEGEEDSSTKYRYAAVIGETGQSMELCQQTYTSCGYSSSQIVELGTQPAGAEESGLGVDLATLEQQATSTTTEVPETAPTVSRPDDASPSGSAVQGGTSSRRNYVETNQYQDNMNRRHQMEQEQFYQERRPPTHNRYQHKHQHPHYHRPVQRPQNYPPVTQDEPESQPESFFNYGDFSDFFRSSWSDTLMGKRRRMRSQRRRVYRYPVEQVREELGI